MADSLRLDVGQLLWIGFAGTELTRAERERFTRGRAGGAILFARNIATGADGFEPSRVRALTDELHALGAQADEPTLVSVDQEGGPVQRLKAPATVWPAMAVLDNVAPDRAVELARFIGKSLGEELLGLGFDVNFAPVLDVHTNEDNPIIGRRALGREPKTVAERGLALAEAMCAEGVLACGKHFPGHGDTDTDSHLALPTLSHDMERLRAVELAPFQEAAHKQIPLIMTAHIVFSALDANVPATLSRKVISELLRRDLGYEGIVVSDDLDMKAIAAHHGAGDAAVQAIDAGCDVLLLCKDPDSQDAAYEALVRRAEADGGFRARVGESATRVRHQKKRLFRKRPVVPTPEEAEKRLGQAAKEAPFAELH